MRIVNQDKNMDLPYENTTVFVEGGYGNMFVIVANVGKVEEYEIGVYSTKKKASDVMDRIRANYIRYKMIDNITRDVDRVRYTIFEMPQDK